MNAMAVQPETGDLFLGGRRIFRSIDGGHTWAEAKGMPNSEKRTNISAIAIDPSDPQTIYASGHGIGVAKSRDGGHTWETKAQGLGGVSTEALTLDAEGPHRVYVWVLGDGLYRSEDAAETWERVDDGPKHQEIRALASADAPTGMGGIWLYAGTDAGVLKSPDCFCGWDRLASEGLPSGRVFSIAVDPESPTTLYAGHGSGVYKTWDGGGSWHLVADEVVDAIVSVHPGNSRVVYAASSDGTLFRSDDAGALWLSTPYDPKNAKFMEKANK